jgi:hypothetical protein
VSGNVIERDNLLNVGDTAPLEVAHELPLYPVELGEGDEVLADNDPGSVRVGVVAERLALAVVKGEMTRRSA